MKMFTYVETITAGNVLHDVYKDNVANCVVVIDQSILEQGLSFTHPYTSERIDSDDDNLFDDIDEAIKT